MASSSLNTIRVRLYFDYPPPATPECRMCWLLVDLNKCRVVADLTSIIKEKFSYSRKTILDLFIEDCYLPTTESIYIVRDNDSVRVKISSPVYVNGAETYLNSESQNSKPKKRGREDETQTSEGLSKKQKHEYSQLNGSEPGEDGKKKKKKKKKKEEKESVTKPTSPQKNIVTPSSTKRNKKSNSAVATLSTDSKNRKPASSSSDSSEDESHKKALPPKPKAKQNDATKKPTVTARKDGTSSDSSSSDDTQKPKSSVPLPVTPKPSSSNTKLALQTPQRRESSTDSSSSSSSSPIIKKSQAASPPSSSTQSSDQPASSSVSKKPQDNAESSDSDGSEIELVIKKPNLHGMGLKIAGLSPGVIESAGRDRGNARSQERSRGRGANRGSGRGGFGRARGTPWKQDFHYTYENTERQKQNDSLTNESFIIQNPPELAPKRDYTALPLLAAPPAVGQKIAFKLLELTENYTPEVSDYKEGKILAFNAQTKVMELELLSRPQVPFEPGKFDLVYQNADGSERVEYAVTHGSQLTERWDSLLEPRLIVESVG